MSDYGIKMSKPNVDVKTAADKDLSWSSEFKTLKLYKVIEFTSTGSEEHGLDYAPTFLALMRVDGVYVPTSLGYQELGYSFASVDEEKAYATNPEDLQFLPYPVNWDKMYIILYIDPLDE